MPNVNDLKSSKFLTKFDVDPALEVTIKSYEEVNVAMESQAPELKWTLSFHELDKPLVLNNTNGQLLMAITGSGDFDAWINKKVVLYNDKTVMFAGKLTGGIRIRQAHSFDNFAKNNPAPADGSAVVQDDGPPVQEPY